MRKVPLVAVFGLVMLPLSLLAPCGSAQAQIQAQIQAQTQEQSSSQVFLVHSHRPYQGEDGRYYDHNWGYYDNDGEADDGDSDSYSDNGSDEYFDFDDDDDLGRWPDERGARDDHDYRDDQEDDRDDYYYDRRGDRYDRDDRDERSDRYRDNDAFKRHYYRHYGGGSC